MIITGLLTGIVFGAVLQRGRFCVTGMLRDIFLNKTWRGFTALLILISVHAFGLTLLTGADVLSPEIADFKPVAVIVGGFIFGLGIILSGGCASGTWYRSAEGLVGSWIALLFYGLSAAAMESGPLAGANDWFKQWSLPVTTIHGALHISPWILVAVLWVVTFLLWRHYRAKDAGSPKVDLGQAWYAKPLNMNVAAIGVGIIGTVGFVLSAESGRNGGLGITTPTADIVRWTATGDSARMNWGTLLVIGLLVGAFIAAKSTGEFRVRVPDAQTATRAIWGGSMMGVGASLAGGCTVGNGMVETSLFSFQGWVSLFFMALGVGAGARLWLKPKKVQSGQPQQPQTYSTEESVDNSAVSAEDKVLPSFATATGAVALKTKPQAKDKARALGGGRYVLDTLGAVCPFPLIEAKQVMAELEPGEALVIDFDCTQATDSIPQWAADEGHEIRDFHRAGDAGWQFTVVKGG